MSAPETNIEKQRKRHIGPIIGISAGLIFAAIIFFLFLGEQSDGDMDDPLADDAAVTTEADQ